MKSIKIIIEKTQDGYFSAYSENVEGIYGMGESVQVVKKDILDAIESLKTLDQIPDFLNDEYELIYKFDTESLLQYYKGILSNPAFEKLTGINQKLIHQYSIGLKKPRENQRKKIEKGLHELGKELLSIEL